MFFFRCFSLSRERSHLLLCAIVTMNSSSSYTLQSRNKISSILAVAFSLLVYGYYLRKKKHIANVSRQKKTKKGRYSIKGHKNSQTTRKAWSIICHCVRNSLKYNLTSAISICFYGFPAYNGAANSAIIQMAHEEQVRKSQSEKMRIRQIM